jgi:hypothetical protein
MFVSGTFWSVKFSGIDPTLSHFIALHDSNNTVIFPCFLQLNSTSLLCNSSAARRVSGDHSDNQVLWLPVLDSAIQVSLLTVSSLQIMSIDYEGQVLTQNSFVSRILSFSVSRSSGQTNYGVVVKASELNVSVVLVFQNFPSPRIAEVDSPGIPISCISATFIIWTNSKIIFTVFH